MTPMNSSGMKSVPRTEHFKPWVKLIFASSPTRLLLESEFLNVGSFWENWAEGEGVSKGAAQVCIWNETKFEYFCVCLLRVHVRVLTCVVMSQPCVYYVYVSGSQTGVRGPLGVPERVPGGTQLNDN